MTALITAAGKGSPLTPTEADWDMNEIQRRTGEGWADLVQQVIVNSGAPNAPQIQLYRNGLYYYAFAPDATNEVYVCFHINHDYTATGGDVGYPGMVYPHIHWSTNTTSTGVVRFGVEYTSARRDDSTGTTAFGATSTLYINHTVTGSDQYSHQVSEPVTGSGIPNAGILETDAVILCRFFRDATDPADTFPDDVFLLTVDIHYPCDHQQTPSRFPPFT